MRKILRLVEIVAGKRRGLLQPMRLIHIQLRQEPTYARGGRTILETCFTAIGKMMDTTHTRDSVHKQQERSHTKEILCTSCQWEILKPITGTTVHLSREIYIRLPMETQDPRQRVTQVIITSNQGSIYHLTLR